MVGVKKDITEVKGAVSQLNERMNHLKGDAKDLRQE